MPASELIVAWCFIVGACVGSFLNVVAWRLPRGMSLSWPGSLCPSCRKPILFRDNVPIIGWLFLRGRCRACGANITARYPLVELFTASAFAALAFAELFGRGGNLPLAAADDSGTLIGIGIYHATLIALLIVTALFELDGAHLPRTFIAAGLAAAIVPPIVLRWLYPVPLLGAEGLLAVNAADLRVAENLFIGFAGLLCGAALGAALEWGCSGGGPLRDLPGNGPLALGLCGAFLGWQAAVSTAVLVAIALVAVRFAGASTALRGAGPALFAPPAALMGIVAWSSFASVAWWPGPYAPLRRLAAAALGVLAASLVLAAHARFRRGAP